MLYQVSYNQTTRVALVQTDGAAVPGGSVDIGSFEHPDDTAPSSKVIFHNIRDMLYKRSAADASQMAMHPDNIMDMQNVSIQYGAGLEAADFVVISAMTFTNAEPTVAVLGTLQLNLDIEPANATDEGVTYESSDTGIATVSASGLVTGVAAGTATITATDDNGEVTAEIEVTVTA
jgi:uncharacterized protein YjdB